VADNDFLSENEVESLVSKAVTKAVKALNTVDEDARPVAPTKAAAFNRGSYGLPNLGIAVKSAFRGQTVNGGEFEKDFSQTAAEIFGYKGAAGDDSLTARSVVWPKTPEEARAVLHAMGETKHATRVDSAIKAATEGTTTAGGYLVPPMYAQEAFQYALVPNIVFRNLPGVTTMPVKSNLVYLPREDSRAGGATAAEAGSLSAQDVTFAQQAITIKKAYGYRVFSNELLADADPSWNEFITKTLLRDVALFADQQQLEGTGSSNEITGLAAISGVTSGPSLGANGAALSFDNLYTAVYNLRLANVEPQSGTGAWIMHPRTLNSLMQLKDSSNQYLLTAAQGYNAPMALSGGFATSNGPKASLLGIPVYVSTQIAINRTTGSNSDTSNVYLVDSSKLVLLERQGIELAFSDQVGFATDQSAYRAIARHGIAAVQPTAVEKITGVRA
jgi:HK97 family phage major capsid protein